MSPNEVAMRESSTSSPVRPQVVIVGAGFGGLNAAWALRSANLEVTVIDRRNHHLFQPLLYQVATAGLSPADIAYPIRAVLRKNRNTRVLLDEVTSIDLRSRRITTTQADIKYDFLIVAAGAENSWFGHDEWSRYAPGLKSLEDALHIRQRILLAFELAERETDPAMRQKLLTFVVVGGGPTGVELAGAIAEISRQVIVSDFRLIDPREAKIILLEAGPRILPSFDERLAAKAAAALSSRGVEIMAGRAAKAITRDTIRLDQMQIEARTIIWAAGVAPSSLAKALGVELERGRVKVKTDLTIAGHPEVFVIGDLAACVDAEGRRMPGLAPVAIQQGRHVARNIERAVDGKPYAPFKYLDKGELATIGRAYAILQMGKIKMSGRVAWLIWAFVHIAYLIGFRSRAMVMLEWSWSYMTDQRGARLITADVEELMGTSPEHQSQIERVNHLGNRRA
jgi:NADH:ubiquinone reductase (H+-translocating)